MKTIESKSSGQFVALELGNGICTIQFLNAGAIVQVGQQSVYNRSARYPYALTRRAA